MSYQIPIELPPGRNDLKPDLALNYNSRSGNGWAGMGWSLDVGAIERNSNVYGVDYTKDNFVFHRAESLSELIPAPSGEYRFENEKDFIKIIKIDNAGQVPSFYFVATNKLGVKYYFGQTENSCIYGPRGVFKWEISRIEDPNGNYISYVYSRDNGQIYLDHIDYNGNQIKFYLEDRNDKVDSYSTNFLVNTAKRLKLIDIVSPNSSRIRSYKLTYFNSTSTGRSILSSVQQFGKDAVVDVNGIITNETIASKLPATTFKTTDSRNGFRKRDNVGYIAFSSCPTYSAGLGGAGYLGFASVCDSSMYAGGSRFMSYAVLNVYSDSFNFFNLLPNRIPISHTYNFVADFIGNGQTVLGAIENGNIYVASQSKDINGGFTIQEDLWPANAKNWGTSTDTKLGDFNGDGLTDIVTKVGTTIFVKRSTGNSFVEEPWNTYALSWGDAQDTWVGDFTGDGRDDIATKIGNTIYVYRSVGESYFNLEQWSGDASDWGDSRYTWIGDFNGDGKIDIATASGNNIWVYLSTGNEFVKKLWVAPTGTDFHWGLSDKTLIGNFNGDGLTDIVTSDYSTIWLKRSTGSGFVEESFNIGMVRENNSVADLDGDGKDDLFSLYPYSNSAATTSLNFPVDFITEINNGIGAITTYEYTPSTNSEKFTNNRMPFPVYALTKVTQNVGGVATDIARISYDGAYYYRPEKDFRGFAHVTVKGPAGPNNEQQITDTWFHQGNDTTVDINNPFVATGYMKGKPYRVRVSDAAENKLSETTIIYKTDTGTAPHFNPPFQVYNTIFDGDPVGRQTRTDYGYDAYGNVNREDHYGDINDSSDDYTIVRTFLPNTTSWIVGLPTTEDIYQGIGTTTRIAGKYYYYDDDFPTCASMPTNNQIPTKGNRTRSFVWYDGGTDISTSAAYDSYGNPLCPKDYNGNISSISYDSSYTFPTIVTNPLGQRTTYLYYGVDSVPDDKGLYGQLKSVTDANNATITIEYDALGRKTKVSAPDITWSSWAYNNFGTVGTQHVLATNSAGIWNASYFDGLGRIIKEQSSGPDSKTIVSDTQYDARGAVSQVSYPYFDVLETAQYKKYTYDAAGRVLTESNPDATRILRILTCYNNGATVKIDANNHRRREVRDVNGRLVMVQEYTGLFDTCTTEPGTPYATTSYTYDVQGNLRFVNDAMIPSNQTEMRYDILGRKRYMSDPDMGIWTYDYDANGNLLTQTDAKQNPIKFTYDVLNRLKTKHYPTGNDVVFTYDMAARGFFNTGRLTMMTDNSGKSVYNYDISGRISASTKTITKRSYTLKYSYLNGLLDKITYPDNDTVSYEYDTAGNLSKAKGYVSYSNFDALGRPSNAAYGSGAASTLYTYDPVNKRLTDLSVLSPTQVFLIKNTYGYDNKGNITSINDHLDKPLPTNFSGETYKHIRAHAVGSTGSGKVFHYDNNGNMDNDGQRSITYNYDNMPIAISGFSDVSFTYDGESTRVNKISPGFNTVYIDKLYECTNGVCIKYIFAGNNATFSMMIATGNAFLTASPSCSPKPVSAVMLGRCFSKIMLPK